MARGTKLLNDDGSASMATMLMLSHHAFRRDITRFEKALGALAEHETARADALRLEWQNYRWSLHGHHQMEDSTIFPSIRQQSPGLGPVIERLSEQHRGIDPLLERGAHAFEGMADVGAAREVVHELQALLDEHLVLEEAEVVPALRGAKQFPAPPDEASLDLYAGGFAWAMHGIADDVLAEVKKLLPEKLLARLPAATQAFEERCVAVWGSAKIQKSVTSVPEG
jgi:Hemerythrin HHE cation binding domain